MSIVRERSDVFAGVELRVGVSSIMLNGRERGVPSPCLLPISCRISSMRSRAAFVYKAVRLILIVSTRISPLQALGVVESEHLCLVKMVVNEHLHYLPHRWISSRGREA